MAAISNMPVSTIEETPQGQLYHFLPSPHMSTYLLAWVIGTFDFVERTSKSGVAVRVYTPVGRKNEGEPALDIGTQCIDFYTEYFGIAYPLKKLDLVSLHSMDARAMENWGCITFVDYALLPQSTNSLDPIHRSARTICHEISHMWFGNLVTMKWWTYLWLNEGFARYMEQIAVDSIRPNYRIWEKFYPTIMSEAFRSDVMPYTHPVEVECRAAKQINSIFDPISYAKGASLIKMLNDCIGEDKFRDAVRLYLSTHAYSNTVSNDLWKAFDEVTGKPIADMMNKWIQIPG